MGKKDIEDKIWIETFVEKCRAYVNQTNDDWKRFVDHTGRWADIENPYFTMDLDFMESVIWCFSGIYNQNKVYKGFKAARDTAQAVQLRLLTMKSLMVTKTSKIWQSPLKFAHQAPKK